MKTLGRNADNDLYIESNSFAIVSDLDAQCAIIESILQTQQGELQFDDEAGIDYFGTILMNPNRIQLWEGIVKSKIQALSFVSRIEDFKYKYVVSESTLYWSMVAINNDGDKIIITDRKTTLSGSPGVDVSWDNVYDKPDGVEESLDMLEGMHHEAVDVGITLSDASTLRQTKEVFNRVVFDPNDKEYAHTRSVVFTMTGVPLGTVIDFECLRIDIQNTPKADGTPYYAPFLIEISDGTKFYSSTTQPMTEDGQNNLVMFKDEDGNLTPFHTIMKGGDVTITFRGNITGIKTSNKGNPIPSAPVIGDEEFAYPIFLDANGEKPFRYITNLYIGSRVPIDHIGDCAFYGFSNLYEIDWNEGTATNITFGDFAFAKCSSLWSLQWIPDNTASVGIGCFLGCTNLTSMKGFSNVAATEIPYWCFAGCSQLTSIDDLNPNITLVGANSFEGCTALTSIDGLPDTVATIGDDAFGGCTSITNLLYLPKDLKVIGARAFEKCTSLVSAYIPSSVESIGGAAFDGCDALEDILFDAGWEDGEGKHIPSMGADTFSDSATCYVPAAYLSEYETALEGKTVKKFGTYTFHLDSIESGLALLGHGIVESDSVWCVSFGDGDKEQRFLKSKTTVPAYTYSQAHQNCDVVIRGYVRRISASETAYPFLATTSGEAFTKLGVVEIADAPLEMIGDYTFAKCTELFDVNLGLPDSEDTAYCLGERAFWQCSNITRLDWLTKGLGKLVKETTYTYDTDEEGNPVPIPHYEYYPAFGEGCFYQSGVRALNYNNEAVTGISAYCFAETGVWSLDGIGGENLTELEQYCFYGCESLEGIAALADTGVTNLPDYCFANCSSLASLEGIENIVIAASSDESEDGSVEEEDETETISFGSHVFENCTSLTTIEPIASAENIAALADYMFAGCTGITNLTGITSKIKELGEYCFSGCTSLASIRALNDATELKVIPAYCFSKCSALTTLIGCYNVMRIETGAFANCYRTETVEGETVYKGLLSTSGLGPSIVSIGDYAFQNCKALLHVSIVSTTVPTLSENAFYGVAVTGVPLYIREGLEQSFASAKGWSSFVNRSSRSIKIVLENLATLSETDAAKTFIDSYIQSGNDKIPGVWYADFGNGEDFKIYYAEDGDNYIRLDNPIVYEPANQERTISVFGDIVRIGARDGDGILSLEEESNLNPDDLDIVPFLGGYEGKASAISIKSPYLQEIGDGCFYNYGLQDAGEVTGNDNALTLTLSMATGGTIGICAFAKDESHSGGGKVGVISAMTAGIVKDFAFYRAGITSSASMTSVFKAGVGSFAYNSGLANLEGFTSVTEIPDRMFEGCSSLTSTKGLTDVVSIGEKAFFGCTEITEVTGLGSEMESIGENAFEGCTKIETIIVTNPNPPWLAEHGFSQDTYDKAIVYVPAGAEAAYKSETIPQEEGDPLVNYWKKFGNRILSLAIRLTFTGVKAGDRIAEGMAVVTATSDWTISYGETGGFREYPSGTTVLPAYTFGTTGDREILISGSVTSISCTESAYPFLGQSKGVNNWLTKVDATDFIELAELGEYVFSKCKNLKEVKNLPSVKTIGANAFANATALKDVSGLTGVEDIGESAFSGCSSLQSLYGLSSVKTIGDRAFNGCYNLKAIDGLGPNITEIGDYAFASCPLEEVQMFAEVPPTIQTNTFSGIDPEKVFLFVRSRYIDSYVGNVLWSNVFSTIRSRYIEVTLTSCPSNVQIDSNHGIVNSNTYWIADWDADNWDGVACKVEVDSLLPEHLYELSGNHTIRLEGGITGMTAKNGNPIAITYTKSGGVRTAVESITGDGSFFTLSVGGSTTDTDSESYVSKLLTKIERSEYAVLENIGDGAFISNKALATTTLSGITTIGKAAFAYCTSITNTELLQFVQTIGECAFYGCTGIVDITNMNGLSAGSAVAPCIEDFAFGGLTNLASVQCGVANPPAFSDKAMPFGYFEPIQVGSEETTQKNINLYVQLNSVSAYILANMWKLFTVASQVVKFVMENVPSGTTIIGLSGNNTVGAGRVEIADGSSGNWYIDWGDATPRDIMTHLDTAFPSHTYEYDEKSPISEEWFSQTVNGTKTWFLKSVMIQLTGDIKAIACQTVTNKPFLAVEGQDGNPYLTSVEASTALQHLTVIGDYAFQNCTALTKVSGFTNVVSIGQYAFQDCASLIDLGDDDTCFKSCTAIGNGAFSGCSSIMSLRAFPKALKLGIRAFANCVGIIETTGLGADYTDVPYYTVYNKTFTVGEDFPLTVTPGKYTYTIAELKGAGLTVDTTGWETIRQVTIDENGKVLDVAWTNNIDLTATFGSYAFENCTFSSINMDAFEAPPTIQNTTFTVDPTKTLVYVPEATQYIDPIELYKNAPGWMLFFDNIIAASSLAFEFYPGIIHGNTNAPDEETVGTTSTDRTGIAIYGMGVVTFTNAIFTIDWGDGSAVQDVTGTETAATTSTGDRIYSAAFPSHVYPASFQPSESYSVTVRLRGSITGIKGVSTGSGNYNPLFAVAPVVKVYGHDAEGNWKVNSATIDTASLRYDALREVTIGGNAKISTIGEGCFYGFTDTTSGSDEEKLGLKFIVIKQSASGGASSLNAIGDKAFYNCSRLQYISNIGGMSGDNPLPSVGDYSFYGCSTLQDNEDQGIWALDFLSGCASIGEGAFIGCSNIKQLSRVDGSGNRIGLNSVSYIGRSAFMGCEGIEKIELPATLTSISDSAFEGCSNINYGIEWEDANASSATGAIGKRAFYGCTAADNLDWHVVIPSQIATIGESAFFNCGMQTFMWNGTGEGTLEGLTTDGAAGIFEGCDNLQSVTISKSVGAIPARAFCMAVNLRTVSIAGSRTSIGNYAFFGCETLGVGSDNTSFANICNGLAAPIGDYAFARCLNLGAITIPESVTALGEGCFSCSPIAFYKGEWYENITYTDTEPPTFNTLTQFEQEMTKTYGGKRLDVWGEYDKILTKDTERDNIAQLSVSWPFSGSNPPARTIGKGCFMNYRNIVIDWSGFQSLTLVPEYCFFNCQTLFQGTNLSALPSGITYFGRFSLARTGMTSIGRGVGTTKISASLAPALFLGCTALESLGDADDGIVNLFSTIPSAIPDGCFYGCSGLYDINALSGGEGLCSIKRLGKYTFAHCTNLSSREDFNITNALAEVTQIGDGCFMHCTGISGIFYGLPKVTYYPFRCFADVGEISNINALCSKSVGESASAVILEGDSFAGVSTIEEIELPYANKVVQIVPVGDYDDPFSSIADEDKASVEVFVPNQVAERYQGDEYWSMFDIYTSYDGMVPAVQLTISIPPSGGTLYGYGSVIVKDTPDSKISIAWGDGTASEWNKLELDNGTSLNLNSIYHDYEPTGGSEDTTATLIIYGDVVSFNGAWDNEVSAKLENRTVVPIFYTNVIATKSGGVPRLAENTWIKDIKFASNELKTIGGGSFGYCTNLQIGTRFPSTIETIGNNAFFGCSSLENLNFLKPLLGETNLNLTSVGSYCFGYCANLSDYSGFTVCTKLTSVPTGCFAKKSSVPTTRNLDWLPPNITSIEFGAFQHFCFQRFSVPLTKADGSPNPIKIGNYAFRYNDSLIDFRNPSDTGPGILMNLTGTNAFRECKNLTTLNGLNLDTSNNTYIPLGSFRQCEKLAGGLSSIPNTITEIRDGAFYKTALTSLSGLSGLTRLENIGSNSDDAWDQTFEDNIGGVFGGCTKLTGKFLQNLPSSVRIIGRAAFRGCTGLEDLTGIPSGITKICQSAFENCTALQDLYGIGDCSSLTSLSPYTFAGCTSLAQVGYYSTDSDYQALPTSIATIGQGCFARCESISYILLARSETVGTITELTGPADVFAAALYDPDYDITIRVPSVNVLTYQGNGSSTSDNNGWYRFASKISALPSQP
jgi:hypothetical protein